MPSQTITPPHVIHDTPAPRATVRKHPSGRILGFQHRFVQKVRSGAKRHTIRKGDLWRAGMTAHLFEKARQRGMKLIFRAPVVKVQSVCIWRRSDPVDPLPGIAIDDCVLNDAERDTLAVADGFKDFAEMGEFWKDALDDTDDGYWWGQIIFWDYEKRFTKLGNKGRT